MRVKGSSASRNKLKKLYSITKGFYGRKKNVYRRAREAYLHALTSAFAGRKLKKRDFRKLWIVRINAAARANGISYSALINGLKKANIVMNRKMLADIAINDAAAFTKLVEKAKNPEKAQAKKVTKVAKEVKETKKEVKEAKEEIKEVKVEAKKEVKKVAKKETAKKETAKKETAKKEAKKETVKKETKTTKKTATKKTVKKETAKKETKKEEK